MAKLVIAFVFEVVRDISGICRRRPPKQTGVFFALYSAVLTFIFLPSSSDAAASDRYGFAPCKSSIFLNGGDRTFVSTDVHVGQIRFGQAKAADLALNWAAGHGLQSALAWLSYRVFTDALMHTSEMVYVP